MFRSGVTKSDFSNIKIPGTVRNSDSIPAANYQRTERFVINDAGFFYRTRENELIGPFVSEAEAQQDLNVYIQVIAIEQDLDEQA